MGAWEGSAWQQAQENAKQQPKAAPAPTPPPAGEEPKLRDRGIGPEKLSVRIFREVFVEAVDRAKLREALDTFLKRVVEHPQTSKSDKTYARKIYTDLSVRVGTPGLPEWAAPQPEISDQELGEILDGASTIVNANQVAKVLNAPPPVTVAPVVMQPAKVPDDVVIPVRAAVSEDDPMDAILEEATLEDRKRQLFEKSIMPILDDFIACKNEYPYARLFSWRPEEKYVALGTVMGAITKGKHTGKKVNAMCVIDGYRRFRDVPEGIAMFQGGRQVSISKEDPETGLRKYIFAVHHKPGLKIRYWMRVDDKDQENGARYMILDDSPRGFRLVTKDQF